MHVDGKCTIDPINGYVAYVRRSSSGVRVTQIQFYARSHPQHCFLYLRLTTWNDRFVLHLLISPSSPIKRGKNKELGSNHWALPYSRQYHCTVYSLLYFGLCLFRGLVVHPTKQTKGYVLSSAIKKRDWVRVYIIWLFGLAVYMHEHSDGEI